ncbi:hypothetical protein M885DRAFT_618576 [Pelagophyceae sp. CCMP2097]|nr:hypothetical protein M885DRAFT_618576 [Pelagophyceae sp. CCMP2097]|mmetsp:Transcript_27569/g.92593  ORF Transcript_27569/g.92593 Transcript_27569/m.92593 type:complete len:704 (+) Transcript_27569:67-2178(+)
MACMAPGAVGTVPLAPSVSAAFAADVARRYAAEFTNVGAFSDPLTFTPTNCLLYSQGKAKLIYKDIELVLGPDATAEAREMCERAEEEGGLGVAEAYALRTEVVSFKKVCLRLFNEARSVENSLMRLGWYFYIDIHQRPQPSERQPGQDRIRPSATFGQERDGPWVDYSVDYATLCQALHSCRGLIAALQEAREVSKWICKLPRHPSMKRPPRLQKLEEQRLSARLEKKARREVFYRKVAAASEAATEDDAGGESDDDVLKAFTRRHATSDHSDLGRWRSADDRGFFMSSLWARGAAKAKAMEAQLQKYAAVLEDEPDRLWALATELEKEQLRTDAAADASLSGRSAADVDGDGTLYMARARSLLCSKHVFTLNAAATVIDATRAAVRAMLGGKRSMFVAADQRTDGSGPATGGLFVDKQFSGLSEGLVAARNVAATYEAKMALQIDAGGGWPPLKEAEQKSRLTVFGGQATCKVCATEGFQQAWVRQGCCWGCERASRKRRQCPFAEACRKRAANVRNKAVAVDSELVLDGFCPHALRCFVCDAWSCEECRLVRGDGDDVFAMVRLFERPLLLCDFDRTLCSTRSGADPLCVSKDKRPATLDEALFEVLTTLPRSDVVVVTRNSHVASIETFLAARGLGGVSVRSAKVEKCAKADIILDVVSKRPPGTTPIFVDDDIDELLDPKLALVPDLHRILFARVAAV